MSFEVRYTNSDPPHQPHGEKPRGVMTRSGGGLRCSRRPSCVRPGLVRTAMRRTTTTRITTRSGSGIPVPAICLGDVDRLCAFPQRAPPHLPQPTTPSFVGCHGSEVVPGQLAELAREGACAIREEDLALGQLPGVDQQLSWGRMRGVVLVADAHLQVAERNPRGLAAPAAVDEAVGDGQEPAYRVDRAGRIVLPSGAKVKVADLDRELAHPRRIAWRRFARRSRLTCSTWRPARRQRAFRWPSFG